MSGAARALLFLAMCSLLGVVVDSSTPPDAAGMGLYPLGLLAVVLLQVKKQSRPWVAVTAVVFTQLTLWQLGMSLPLSFAFAISGVAAAWLALLLLRPAGGTAQMRTERDLLRVAIAVVAGGGVVALSAGFVGALTGVEQVMALLLGTFVDQIASLVLWLPWLLLDHDAPSLARWQERVTQWVLLILGTVLVFSLTGSAEFSYVVLVLLMWGGLRLSLLETMIQLVVVRVVVIPLTTREQGPYATVTAELGLPGDLHLLHVQLFLITCSVAVLALNISSTKARTDSRREALAKADVAAESKLNTVFEALEAERSALEEMREVDRVKDSFVSTVSHELRTPITNIIGYTEMLEDGDFGGLSPDQSEATVRIGANGRRLLSLIDDLLDLSRLRSVQMEITMRPVDLVKVVRAGEDAIRPRLPSAQVSLAVEVPPQPVMVSGESSKLERVMVNLMSNAIKFTPPQGRVTVRLSVEATWAIIEVTDTGYGIPAEDLDRLFSQFFRSSVSEQRHIQGTGLGLSIVRSIVEGHGGQVEVNSTENVGTTFRVYLPC